MIIYKFSLKKAVLSACEAFYSKNRELYHAIKIRLKTPDFKAGTVVLPA
jgi:hypothetical protein